MQAGKAVPGSPEWVLFAAAAFDALVEHPQILVGGAAQVVHTRQQRPTDIDLVGSITPRDVEALAEAGFEKQGRHWVYAWKRPEGIDVEVPDSVLLGEDPPIEVDVGGHPLRVISLHDLMMDRLVQATDRHPTTWEEAVDLAKATYARIDWPVVRARCMVKRREDIGLHILPQVLDELLAELETGRQQERDDPTPSLDVGF